MEKEQNKGMSLNCRGSREGGDEGGRREGRGEEEERKSGKHSKFILLNTYNYMKMDGNIFFFYLYSGKQLK